MENDMDKTMNSKSFDILGRMTSILFVGIVISTISFALVGAIGAGILKSAEWIQDTKERATSAIETVAAGVIEKYVPTRVVKHIVYRETLPIRELVTAVAERERFPALVLHALVAHESNYYPSAMRTERQWFGKFKPDLAMMNEVEKDILMASTYGLTQVSWGWWRETCKKAGVVEHVGDLFDPERNLRCAIAVLRTLYSRQPQQQTEARKLRATLRSYNGDGANAEAYADAIMAKLMELNFDDAGRRLSISVD
jgi:hypothetical protein